MSLRKEEPIITYTEILNLAIMTIDEKINKWTEQNPEVWAEFIDLYRAKRDVLTNMYKIETGRDYGSR